MHSNYLKAMSPCQAVFIAFNTYIAPYSRLIVPIGRISIVGRLEAAGFAEIFQKTFQKF
jgi:hypothetical protein